MRIRQQNAHVMRERHRLHCKVAKGMPVPISRGLERALQRARRDERG